MIWPEFEDEVGNIINEDKTSVLGTGTARMWIADPDRRQYHRDKIKVGLKGYFMEGPRKIAESIIIEILGLSTNPDSFKKK